MAKRKTSTSHPEDVRRDNPAPHAHREADKGASHPEIPIAPRSAPKPELQPSETHQEITSKPEKNWWDKTKPSIEIAGVVLLAIYTGYTIKMYRANKQAADAATSAANTASSQFQLTLQQVEDSNGAHVTVTPGYSYL